MLTREAVAAALALAGIRTGAHVLDLAPAAGLSRAARAMAGSTGRVDEQCPTSGDPGSTAVPAGAGPYGYLLAVRSDSPPEQVVAQVEAERLVLEPGARVTLGCAGSLAGLVDQLRTGGWTVLHATTVLDADPAVAARTSLALAVARPPLPS